MLLKKVLGWVFLSIGIISGIITISQWIGYLNIIGVIRKMFEFFLIKVALFWATITISTSLCVFSFIAWQILKSYNELAERTKSPSEVIVIKAYRIAEVAKGTSKYPFLRFRLDVISHSYYNFRPKGVRIVCHNNEEEVGEDEWREGMETGALGFSGIKGYIDIGSKLSPNGESYINFKVPIKKEYNRLECWDLKGHAEYESEEGVKSVEIYTSHYLAKHAEDDLRKKLKEAIGCESE